MRLLSDYCRTQPINGYIYFGNCDGIIKKAWGKIHESKIYDGMLFECDIELFESWIDIPN